jgi:hypothetical protein
VSRVTIEDIKAMTEDFITPAAAASVMKMDTGRLIGYARGGQLPFPVVVSGNRVKIPRIGFLRFLGVEEEERDRKNGIEAQLKELTREVRALTAVMLGWLVHSAPEIAEKIMADDEMKEALQ